MLTAKDIANQVLDLTGTTGSVLASRVKSIADVRNALAHNRAISDDTLAVLKGDLVVVRSAVRRFKSQTLYAESEIILDSAPADLLSIAASFEVAVRDLRGQQLFMSANDDFVMLVAAPGGALRSLAAHRQNP